MTDNQSTRSPLPAWFASLPESRLHRAAWVFLGGLTMVRLLVLLLPLDLSGDESYYWEWGRRLDWGYYSKPPGIGWLMAFAGLVGGQTTAGIRLFAVLLGTGGLWLFHELARRVYGDRTALLALIVFALTPASAALGLLLTIDAPLLFCWITALLCLWRFLESGARAPGWAVGLGLALAAGMLAKQMMLVFIPLTVAYTATSSTHRGCLRRPLFWMAMLLPLVAWIPPLWWNTQHDWITASHTLHHFETGSPSLKLRLARFVEFVGAAVALPTPVFGLLIAGLIPATFLAWKRLGPGERFLWVFSVPGLVVITLLSLRQRINANWPAAFLPAMTLLLAGWLAAQWSTGLWLDRWRRATAAGLAVALLVTTLLYGLVTAFSLEWLPPMAWDPTRRLRGWSVLAGEVAQETARYPDLRDPLFITQGHRDLASELAFYLPGQPVVWPFRSQPDRILSQYDLWELPADRLGRDAFLVVEGGPDRLDPDLVACFESVTQACVLERATRFDRQRLCTLFIGRQLRDWPWLERPPAP